MLRLENVRKAFRSGQDIVLALGGVNLDLAKGDFLTVIGSNGAGKTTLLNIIAGTILPTVGRVSVKDRDVTTLPAYRRAQWIGRITQDPLAGTAPMMTIAENLALASKRAHRSLRLAITRRKRREMVERMLSLGMALEHRLDDPVSLLSGGERQALTVTMATLAQPEILLLDEHTAALDPANAAKVSLLTQEFVERLGVTTIMVTHNMEHALALGNRLLMMNKGEIIYDFNGGEKGSLTVVDLVDLFSRQHIVDDELLLEAR
ncbi:ATP-binding cassette domain-containing protein [Candidatus Bipolaricaulota bacterium]|nr:ATP-binding cassette domain-containing protein [Candidatus Bipolaricaulota bacterium]HHR86061.1 ATP-binding cassette domain-containing protein [Candidatus Acetothermia bacterium]